MSTKIKIAMAQISPEVGNFVLNEQLLYEAGVRAYQAKANLVVFGDGALSGYVRTHEQIPETTLKEMMSVASLKTPGMEWIVGGITLGSRKSGALLAKDGHVTLLHLDQEESPIRTVCGVRTQITGTQWWADTVSSTKKGSDLVVCLSSQPQVIEQGSSAVGALVRSAKSIQRPSVIVSISGGYGLDIVAGASAAINKNGQVACQLKRYASDFTVLDLDVDRGVFGTSRAVDDEVLSAVQVMREQAVFGIREYSRKTGLSKIVIGSSGGLDSALCLALAVEAIGADNVIAITMPSKYSSAGSVDDSVTLCRNLGVALHSVPIQGMIEAFSHDYAENTGAEPSGLAKENLQARMRANILMTYSNMHGAMVICTCNKSEDAMGYSTLGGDTSGAIAPIADIYKTECFEMCRLINRDAEIIPWAIINKRPSAELSEGQFDEDSLPPYDQLDAWLKVKLELLSFTIDEVRELKLVADQIPQSMVFDISKRLIGNEFKRRMSAPPIKMRAHTFGDGIHLPLVCAQPSKNTIKTSK